MAQGQDVPAAAELPSLSAIIEAWNLVSDHMKPLALYLAKENLMTLEDLGALSEAMLVVANVLQANLKLHNESVLIESNRRSDAEKTIREKLAQKQAERDALEHGEVVKTVKVDSKKNDPPVETKPEPETKAEPEPAPGTKGPTAAAASAEEAKSET